MMARRSSRSAVTETTAGKRLLVLADVGQLVDVFDAARGLDRRAPRTGRDLGCELETQCFGTRDQFPWIRDVGRRDPVHHVGGQVAEHPLRPDVEDLNDAVRVGCDAGEVGAVEDRILQRACLEQAFLACRFLRDVRFFASGRTGSDYCYSMFDDVPHGGP